MKFVIAADSFKGALDASPFCGGSRDQAAFA